MFGIYDDLGYDAEELWTNQGNSWGGSDFHIGRTMYGPSVGITEQWGYTVPQELTVSVEVIQCIAPVAYNQVLTFTAKRASKLHCDGDDSQCLR